MIYTESLIGHKSVSMGTTLTRDKATYSLNRSWQYCLDGAVFTKTLAPSSVQFIDKKNITIWIYGYHGMSTYRLDGCRVVDEGGSLRSKHLISQIIVVYIIP